MTSRSTRIGAPSVRSRHAVLATLTVGLLALSACSSGSGSDGASTQAGQHRRRGGPVTLTLATFNQFGYEELIPEFEKSHPNIKVTHKKAATSNEARDNFFTRLSAGSGMADVEAVEVDWLPEMLQYSDKFNDLNCRRRPGPLARLEGQGRHRRRRPPHRLRHRLRPRGDLLPQRPLQGRRPARATATSVAKLFGNTWESYFAAGKQFKAKSKVPFFDSIGATYQGMVNQLEAAYENPGDDAITATDNADGQEGLRPGRPGRHHRRPLGQAPAVGRRLDRELPEGRLRDDALPRLDGRRHRGQRQGRQGLGRRQHLPRRRRQLGRLATSPCRSRAPTRRRPRSSPRG